MTPDPDVALVERAYAEFRREYAANFPQGGDESDHDEAQRCGVEAVMVLAEDDRTRRMIQWLRGRSGARGGGFTCADDVADALHEQFTDSGTVLVEAEQAYSGQQIYDAYRTSMARTGFGRGNAKEPRWKDLKPWLKKVWDRTATELHTPSGALVRATGRTTSSPEDPGTLPAGPCRSAAALSPGAAASSGPRTYRDLRGESVHDGDAA